ncbi:MAG: glycosyltransferase [Ignavibacteriae bacterium]|nr:glycosyltransferase [Ignavibacteriota bacterium]
MKEIFVFMTSNTFCTLPPVKQLYNYIQKLYNTVVIESKIETFEDYFINADSNHIIYNYKSYDAYFKQPILAKVIKHIKALVYVLKLRFNYAGKNSKVYLYTFELYIIWLAIIFKTKNLFIIYHQFEMVIPDQINILDKFYLNYITKNWSKVDIAIFPERNRINYFKEIIFQFDESKFLLIPNSNNNFTNNSEKANNSKVRVVHIGALGINHHINSLIEVLKILPEDKFEFYLIGNISEEIIDIINRLERPNVFTLPQVKHHELSEIYLTSDIGLILYQNDSPNTIYCAPNKLYEFWSFGIPVIGDQLPGLKSVFKDSLQGMLVNMKDPNELKNAILSLASFEKSDNLRLKIYFNENFKLDLYLKKLETKLKELK